MDKLAPSRSDALSSCLQVAAAEAAAGGLARPPWGTSAFT